MARARSNRQSHVLASLRATQLLYDASDRLALPAELLDLVLDHLPVRDLLRCARTSKKLQEMVFDDSRWVRRLQAMGCWNEVEARRRADSHTPQKTALPKHRGQIDHHPKADYQHDMNNGLVKPGRHEIDTPLGTLESNAWANDGWRLDYTPSVFVAAQHQDDTAADGFSSVTWSANTTSTQEDLPRIRPSASIHALGALSRVRSVRGKAMVEYAKVHKLLGPYYGDLTGASDQDVSSVLYVFSQEQRAQMLAQLRAFANSDFSVDAHIKKQRLEAKVDDLRKNVLARFAEGISAEDYDGLMKRCAYMLHHLDSDTMAIEMFASRNPIILHKLRFGSARACVEDASTGSIAPSSSLAFFRSLSAALREQANVTQRVFPLPLPAFFFLFEKVIDCVMTPYITAVLDLAQDLHLESYLKSAASLFGQGLEFVNEVESFPVLESIPKEKVESLVMGCFESHVELYLHEELQFFKNKSLAQVDDWEQRRRDVEASDESFFMAHVNRQTAKMDFMKSFKKVIMMPVNVVATVPSYFVNTRTPTSGNTKTTALGMSDSLQLPSRPTTPASGSGRSSPRPLSEAPTTELAAKAALMSSRLASISSLFSIEVALSLVQNAKTSLERAALFVKMGGVNGTEAGEQCVRIFVELLSLLGTRHLQAGFDKAILHLSTYDPRAVAEHGTDAAENQGVGPLVTFIELVNMGDLIMQMVDVFFVQELVATKLVDRDDFLNQAVKDKKRFEQMLDSRVAAGLNKGIDVLVDEIEFLCATMQPAGTSMYSPGTAAATLGPKGRVVSTMVDIGPTALAMSVVNLVSSHTSMLTGSTDKNLLDVFNQEVGIRLFEVLCKHFKRQRISVDGAMILISDTTHYYTYILTLKNKALTPYFAALREMSQLFLVDAKKYPKELASIIADQNKYSGVFRAEDVLEFAERRADWMEVRYKVERAMFGMGCSVM